MGTPAAYFNEREHQICLVARMIEDGHTYWGAGGGSPMAAILLAKQLLAPEAGYVSEDGGKRWHMVSIWACEEGLTLGQLKVAGKSNEITAIPELLKLIDIEGCTITIDAMGAQIEIADIIHSAVFKSLALPY